MCGRMAAWSLILLRVFRLLVLVSTYLLLNLLYSVLLGRRLRSIGMLEWKGVVLLCLSLPLQTGWPGHFGMDNLNVVRSVARLLDHGSLSKPLPLGLDGVLLATVFSR